MTSKGGEASAPSPLGPAGSRAGPNTVKGLEYLLRVETLRELELPILEKKTGRGLASMCTDDLNGQNEGPDSSCWCQ